MHVYRGATARKSVGGGGTLSGMATGAALSYYPSLRNLFDIVRQATDKALGLKRFAKSNQNTLLLDAGSIAD